MRIREAVASVDLGGGIVHAAIFPPIPAGFTAELEHVTLVSSAFPAVLYAAMTDQRVTVPALGLDDIIDVSTFAAWDRRSFAPPVQLDTGRELSVYWFNVGAGQQCYARAQWNLYPSTWEA